MIASIIFTGCSNNNNGGSSSLQNGGSSQQETVPEVTDAPVQATGGKVHIQDSQLGDIWITELEGVERNKLDKNGFGSNDGSVTYTENGSKAALQGIDVSYNCGDIDWKKVKESGIEFVMVRLGGRGYGDEGGLYTDDKALEYINNARAEGIKVGGYFFSQAINNDEAAEEADYAVKILGDIKLDFPLAYDWEIIKDDSARTDSVSSAQTTECARVFCEEVKKQGYIPMIYSPSRELYFKYDLAQLKDFDIWYCEYADHPNFYYQFSMWQYSSNGKVNGIDAEVDLNLCFTNVADYA
jgi:GH25 family lysozyme M1 (1,4-beta-N-acetylmuramidase)